MFFSSGTASVFKSNPLQLPLRKGERGLSPLFVFHLDNHFRTTQESQFSDPGLHPQFIPGLLDVNLSGRLALWRSRNKC